MGKALLAFRSRAKIESVTAALDFVALTHNTITSREALLADLEMVRTRGYAVNDEELSVGLRSVAAPVLDAQGWSMAALNIAVSTTRMSREELESRLAPLVMRTARDIEAAMSFLDEDGRQDLGRETESPGWGAGKQAKRPVAMN